MAASSKYSGVSTLPALATSQGVCTSAQIQAFVSACGNAGTQAACEIWQATNVAGYSSSSCAGTPCGNCIFGPTNGGYGAFYELEAGFPQANFGACVIAQAQTSGAGAAGQACAIAIDNLDNCTALACMTCATSSDYSACFTQATTGSGPCAQQNAAWNSACNTSVLSAAITACTPAGTSSNQDPDFTYITNLFCGGTPVTTEGPMDAGLTDGGRRADGGLATDASTHDASSSSSSCPIATGSGPPTLTQEDTGLEYPAFVAVDDLYLYATVSGTGVVERCSKTNCSATRQTISTGQSQPAGIAVDSAWVYWANQNSGTVVRCPKSGCSGQPQVVFSNATLQPWDVKTNGSYVCWSAQGTLPSTGIVQCVPNASAGTGTPTTVASGLGFAGSLALRCDGTLVWSDMTAGTIGQGMAGVVGARTIAQSLQEPDGVAIDASYVYATVWGASSGGAKGTVIRVPVGGGTTQTLWTGTVAGDSSCSTFIAVAGTDLYFTVCESAGAVMKMSTTGAAATPVVSNYSYPFDIATDATTLYFATNIPGGGLWAAPL
jgi:hypothetical protein